VNKGDIMQTNKLQNETTPKTLLIIYDIQKPDMDYKDLHDMLKSANAWCHHINLTWFIKTDESIKYWYDKLQKVIDPKDYFIIIDITGQSKQGSLPKEIWEWFENNDSVDNI